MPRFILRQFREKLRLICFGDQAKGEGGRKVLEFCQIDPVVGQSTFPWPRKRRAVRRFSRRMCDP
ncbi:MAG: hypothetical protein C0606_03445 [Hyphomicrobiales bacterium]|nr:MAG: hypothetical protein C0606_03445 [Hyphomicrobiales bacterium]